SVCRRDAAGAVRAPAGAIRRCFWQWMQRAWVGIIMASRCTMPLTITDQQLRAMGMDEAKARIEIACRLFDAGLMAFGHASSLAGISQDAMGEEIERRGIPRYRY